MSTHDTPDETPRATLREDERAEQRAIAKVLTEHYWDLSGPTTCKCGWSAGFADNFWRLLMLHVAEQIAPLVATARADERERVAAAIESEAVRLLDYEPQDKVDMLDDAARIARGGQP